MRGDRRPIEALGWNRSSERPARAFAPTVRVGSVAARACSVEAILVDSLLPALRRTIFH